MGGMTFLPVVERELRVASRKRSTFRVRTYAAVAALLIGTVFFLLTTFGPGFGMLNLGKGLFSTLTWLNLAVALCAGLFFTSDCLSEEKREGTIGFLFLTDLRGHDVVLGKLLATSLKGASWKAVKTSSAGGKISCCSRSAATNDCKSAQYGFANSGASASSQSVGNAGTNAGLGSAASKRSG